MTSSAPIANTLSPIPLDIKKGTELRGRYVISEVIGAGGFWHCLAGNRQGTEP
jgi:hypothetical protein